ncbi:YdcF family protein [Sphingomonas sanguinis]|uniref:YdcF family protein n=1 Tax=Sphingomonas sanguinis TaxID=33051 RepID=A0ABU5LL57_9SPHN|nr:YdcF family protein [Sphingomonas sanguinis]MDZ7280435.1 YdcF family protein [Sphingomonas sanguinis]
MGRMMAAALAISIVLPLPAIAETPVRDGQLAAMAERLFPALHGPLAGDARDRRVAACTGAPACVVAAAILRDEEREALAARSPDRGDDVRRQVDGLNEILRVYGVGKLPRYPLIDGSDAPFGSEDFAAKVADAVVMAGAQRADPAVGGDISLSLALALLDANDKNAAVAFEPLDQRYNAAAFRRARILDWGRYRYTAILVLGVGPDDLETPLSAKAKVNVRVAAEQYAKGLAPFLIVSGGAVHPRDTPHVEALEMRRALIERYGIPAEAIVIDPYARHTTTNLRNATRRLIAMGAPLDRDMLVVSNARHIDSIASPGFVERNRRELGYQPATADGRVAPTAIPMRPSRDSLQIDPADPLDP